MCLARAGLPVGKDGRVETRKAVLDGGRELGVDVARRRGRLEHVVQLVPLLALLNPVKYL